MPIMFMRDLYNFGGWWNDTRLIVKRFVNQCPIFLGFDLCDTTTKSVYYDNSTTTVGQRPFLKSIRWQYCNKL